MKKIFAIAAAALVAFSACNNGGIPKGNPKTDLDTLSYELGVANSQGVKMYIAHQLGVDTTYMDEFFKGFAAAAQAGDDKKKAAYYAGIQIGQQIGTQLYDGINHELFGEDSTKHANLAQLVAGFIDGAKGNPLIPMDTIRKELTNRVNAYKDQVLMLTYGDNKQQSDKFIADKAKEAGMQKLPGGTLYKVITEGTGAKPEANAKVKVVYEGKTVDGNVFDSSEKNNEGKATEIVLSQVIPAWQEALVQMPEGSEWELYVPYDQAYGNQTMGEIKPFSALIFKIKLEQVNSDVTDSASGR